MAADIRGESRGSYHSQSQYSESTVINQDIADPDLFQAEIFPTKAEKTSPQKNVTFAPDSHLERAQSIEQLASQPLKFPNGGGRSAANHLLARLVDRSENSQALRVARGQPRVTPSVVPPIIKAQTGLPVSDIYKSRGICTCCNVVNTISFNSLIPAYTARSQFTVIFLYYLRCFGFCCGENSRYFINY